MSSALTASAKSVRRAPGLRGSVGSKPTGNRNVNIIVRAAAVETKPASDWAEVTQGLDKKSPLEIMDHALATFGTEVAIAFSGAEDVALIEYAHLTGRDYRVFSLDTGRLNPETYQLFDQVEKHYNIRIEYTFPDAQETMDLVREKGLFSFYEDGHQECCRCALCTCTWVQGCACCTLYCKQHSTCTPWRGTYT